MNAIYTNTGTHLDIYNSVENIRVSFKSAVDYIANAKCDYMQIFLPPSLYLDGGKPSTFNKSDLKWMNKYSTEKGIKIIVHSLYTHNIAKNWDKHSWWISSIISEIKYASIIGAKSLVLHFGKHKTIEKSQAYNNMFTSLVYIHNNTKKYINVRILLETPAGQGTEMCSKLEDLSVFLRKFQLSVLPNIKKRFGVCIDTCHIFASGYPLYTKLDALNYLDKFDELVGIKYIGAIHMNDSKNELGSNVDRHDSMGHGKISKNSIEGLKYFYKFFKAKNVPCILETPTRIEKDEKSKKSRIHDFKDDLVLLS